MTTEQLVLTVNDRARLIGAIIGALRAAAGLQDKAFDEADTFFALAFRSDAELLRIAQLCGKGD